MSTAGRKKQESIKNVAHEERLARLRELIVAHSDEAANVLKMWLRTRQSKGFKRK